MAIIVRGAPPWEEIVTDLRTAGVLFEPKVLGEIVTVILGAETGELAIEGIVDVLLRHGLKLIAQEIGQLATKLTRQGFQKLKDWASRETKQLTKEQQKMAIAQLTGTPTCVTPKAQHKGICCQALTQLGAAQAAQGFQYQSCTGKTVCLACGTKASVSKKHPGQTVFDVRRVSCGPSGCPALGAMQGQIIVPA